MKTFARSDRVSSELQKIISDILQKDIHDPRLHMVTVTGVKMSKDLRNARVYFSLAPGR
jgi:ribosome-binding factor A